MAVAQPALAAPPAEARAARTSPGSLTSGGLVSVSLAVGLLLLYVLWEFWPTQAILKATSAEPVHVFGIHRLVSPEVRLLVVVALAGALGGLMHSTRSLAWYIGHQQLMWRWVPYYLVTIVLGAGLASIFYLVLRGGVLGGNATSADTNPYGFAAIGALVGLFSEQALEMLRHVATQVFAAAPQGTDAVPSTSSPDPGGADTSTTSPDTGGADTPTSVTPTPVATTPDPTAAVPGPVAAPADTPVGSSTALAAQTGTASNVTATSATLEGDVSSDAASTSYHFDLGPTTDYGTTTAVQIADGTAGQTHVTADVDGLTPGTEYHFRVVIADAVGQSTTGDDGTFTTAAG